MLPREGSYEADIHIKKFQALPRKFWRTTRIPNGSGYIKVSLYVPDTPYSRYPPKPTIAITSGKTYCRIVLDEMSNYLDLKEKFDAFLDKFLVPCSEALKEARADHYELHAKIPQNRLINAVESNS